MMRASGPSKVVVAAAMFGVVGPALGALLLGMPIIRNGLVIYLLGGPPALLSGVAFGLSRVRSPGRWSGIGYAVIAGLVGTGAWFLILALFESIWMVYAALIAVPLGGLAAAGLALMWTGAAAALSSLLGADQIGGAKEAPPI